MEKKENTPETTELSVFLVDELFCGIDIKNIQEINKYTDITPVTNAPKYIRGILNLRGNIITVIDMRAKFGMEVSEEMSDTSRILVINDGEEQIGLLIDRMVDVVEIQPDQVEPPPSNIQGVAGKYFSSILKQEERLVAILNTEEILKMEENR